MKLRDFGLLTDENLDPDVVRWLSDAGFDVFDVCLTSWREARGIGFQPVLRLNRR